MTTGWTYVDAVYYANLVGLRSPIITANGAYIQNKESHQLIYQVGIKKILINKLPNRNPQIVQ
jgi:hydroxymethylpyrimidine pyrophosphatase-like HAD family hydrolase